MNGRFTPNFRQELSPLAKIVDALEQSGSTVRHSGKGYAARCPAHEDDRASLSVGEGDDHAGLVFCHAGCETDAVLAAIGLTLSDLFVPRPKKEKKSRKVATYDYRDQDGNVRYQVVRTEPKGFFQRRPNGLGGWTMGLGGEKPILYRLPEVIDAVANHRTVYLPEGEKDVDALVALGIWATTSPMGAGTGKWRPEFTDVLAGADEVVIIADADTAGRRFAWTKAEALEGRVGRIRVVEALVGNDVSDHLAHGYTVADLVDTHAPVEPELEGVVPLASVKPKGVEWRWPGRFPKGKVVVLDGDPGLGKSTFTLDVAARVSTGRAMPDGFEPDAPAGVLLCSAEDDAADTIVPRLMAAGADMDRCFLLHRVPVMQSDGSMKDELPEFPTHCAYVEQVIRNHRIGLFVIDPLMAYLASETNSFQDQHVRRALLPLKELAERTGATVLVVRHLNKSEGGTAIYRGGGSIGIVGASRAALLIGKNPEQPGHRVLAVTKINNSVTPDSLGYHIVEHPELECSQIVWDGPTGHSADDLVRQRDAEKEEDRSDAANFLRTAIGPGNERKASEVTDEAKEFELTPKMLRHALMRMGGDTRKGGFQGEHAGWLWSLPEDS